MKVLQPRGSILLAGAVVALMAAAPLAADTIYLKNGRTIDTASATVEGDRVVFVQFGHPFAIPLSEVDRIEKNDRTGPPAEPAPVPAEPAAAGVARGAGQGDAAPAAPPAAAPAPAEDPEQTREYWQDRVRTINAEAERLQLELRRLRRIERAFTFAHMSTAETRRQIEDVQERIAANERALPELRREARREGIPPGWLRLRSGG